MAKIIWAPSALKDIDAIAEYIEKDSREIWITGVTHVARDWHPG